MTQSDWSRPHWSRADAKAMLLYCVFGEFAAELTLDLSGAGGHGLPPGMGMQRVPRGRLAHWPGNPLRGALGEVLRDADGAAFAAARAAPECLLVRGEVADADALHYLRDTLGVVTALLDVGGVAVVDPQTLSLFTGAAWQARYAPAVVFVPRDHVVVLCQPDAAGQAWIKTRGLRKFARPDVSIRGVPEAAVQAAGAVAARVAELQVRGMRFGDGSVVAVAAPVEGLRVTRCGALDDPEFNNTRIEMRWPNPCTR